MFYNCPSLRTLSISNFNFLNINNLYNMFNGSKNMEYININILYLNGTIKNIFLLTDPDLVICGKNNEDISINSYFFSKINIYCNNNKNYFI